MWRIESRRTEILIGVAAEPITITTAESSRDSIDPTNASPLASSTRQSPPPAGGSPVGRGKRMPRIASRGNTNGSANAGDRHTIAPCGLSMAAGPSANVPAMNPSPWRSRTAATGSASGAAAAAASTCVHAPTARRTAHRNRIASRLRWLVAVRIVGTVVMGALGEDGVLSLADRQKSKVDHRRQRPERSHCRRITAPLPAAAAACGWRRPRRRASRR